MMPCTCRILAWHHSSHPPCIPPPQPSYCPGPRAPRSCQKREGATAATIRGHHNALELSTPMALSTHRLDGCTRQPNPQADFALTHIDAGSKGIPYLVDHFFIIPTIVVVMVPSATKKAAQANQGPQKWAARLEGTWGSSVFLTTPRVRGAQTSARIVTKIIQPMGDGWSAKAIRNAPTASFKDFAN